MNERHSLAIIQENPALRELRLAVRSHDVIDIIAAEKGVVRAAVAGELAPVILRAAEVNPPEDPDPTYALHVALYNQQSAFYSGNEKLIHDTNQALEAATQIFNRETP